MRNFFDVVGIITVMVVIYAAFLFFVGIMINTIIILFESGHIWNGVFLLVIFMVILVGSLLWYLD
jgi:hypothetical protein